MISRRKALHAGASLAALTALGAPSILHAQTKTLKITTWGGKWGDIMKATVLPAFEKEFKCTVSADQAFPYVPKLQASPRNDPLYDVLHTNSNEQWNCLVGRHRALELILEGRNDRGFHDVAPLAAPGRDLERPGLGMKDRRRAQRRQSGQARTRLQCLTT